MAGRLTYRAMLDRGLSALLQIEEPVVVELVLRAPGHGVLARHRTRVAVAGRVRLRLRAQMTVTMTDAAGNKATARRTVTLRRAKR